MAASDLHDPSTPTSRAILAAQAATQRSTPGSGERKRQAQSQQGSEEKKRKKDKEPEIFDPEFSRRCEQFKRSLETASAAKSAEELEAAAAKRRQVDSRTPSQWDDDQGHYKFKLGESLTPRYKVLSLIGSGTFGKVVEAWDRDNKSYVAIKIIRSIPKYRDAAMIEIQVLSTINKNDKLDKNHLMHMITWFDFRNHICMVFPKLGLSLYDFLRKNNYRAFIGEHVRSFAKQILEGLSFLHDQTLIHTDLKPENILLCNPQYQVLKTSTRSSPKRVPVSSEIKIIDFGSATFDSHYHTKIVSTRHYRGPEIILGLGWTYPCDIWSVGCILVELYCGDTLFQTHENAEHLAMMQHFLGPLPPSMIRLADRHSAKYFRRDRLNWPNIASSTQSIAAVNKLPSLEMLFRKDDRDLLDLVRWMLSYEPSDRPTAKQALRHQYFKNRK